MSLMPVLFHYPERATAPPLPPLPAETLGLSARGWGLECCDLCLPPRPTVSKFLGSGYHRAHSSFISPSRQHLELLSSRQLQIDKMASTRRVAVIQWHIKVDQTTTPQPPRSSTAQLSMTQWIQSVTDQLCRTCKQKRIMPLHAAIFGRLHQKVQS
jgi:hypothetical protein